jgi:hypothetical protein
MMADLWVVLPALQVIYGDTDSIMIHTNSNDYEAAEALGAKVKAAVNRWAGCADNISADSCCMLTVPSLAGLRAKGSCRTAVPARTWQYACWLSISQSCTCALLLLCMQAVPAAGDRAGCCVPQHAAAQEEEVCSNQGAAGGLFSNTLALAADNMDVCLLPRHETCPLSCSIQNGLKLQNQNPAAQTHHNAHCCFAFVLLPILCHPG